MVRFGMDCHVFVALVEYDVDNDEIVRDAAGRCVLVKAGEPGLLLGKITEDTVFEGYTDPEATEKKIVRSALETDDAWFNSGDLMRTVDVGFTLGYPHYQFVDRVGDTFRWKSENVSTNEVGEIINGFDQIKFCNVYGVEIPGTDGRAGMAAVTLQDGVSVLDNSNKSTRGIIARRKVAQPALYADRQKYQGKPSIRCLSKNGTHKGGGNVLDS